MVVATNGHRESPPRTHCASCWRSTAAGREGRGGAVRFPSRLRRIGSVPNAPQARDWGHRSPWQDVGMRFKADGPTIPNILLEERDAGKVVFLCGAGVSIPAGLPSFVQLTRHVIEEVDPAQDSEIRRMFGPWSEEYSTVPGGVRPGLDHLFQLLNREYGRERVARIVWERLAKVDSTRTREHDIVARISANAEGDPQIVTTNFDRLFESALAERVTPIHKPPMYPDLRYGVPATGITYLHGRAGRHRIRPARLHPEQRRSRTRVPRARMGHGVHPTAPPTPHGRTPRLSGRGPTGTVLDPRPRQHRQTDGQTPVRVR